MSKLALILAVSVWTTDRPWSLLPAPPDRAAVDRIEAYLTRSSCLGDLKRWDRAYQYQTTVFARLPGVTLYTYDHDRIEFNVFARSGGVGQRIMWGEYKPMRIFDGQAFGHYDVAANRIHLSSCYPPGP